MAKLSKWTHPKTGETRVYINDLPEQRRAKIWAVEVPVDPFGLNYDICAFVPDGQYTRKSDLINAAEAAINAAAGERVKTFAAVVALAR